MTTYNVRMIADYFLSLAKAEGDMLSNLKMQKLCYYAAGTIAALRQNSDEPLFKEGIEAWQHGPVIPDLYHEFKKYGSNGIDACIDSDLSQIEERDKAVLDDVFSFYGQYSPWKLRNMTHEETPWIEAFDSKVSDTINEDALSRYFINEVSDEYIESYKNGKR